MCGEYGEKYKRPHYHALIFGYDFPDKKELHLAGRKSKDKLYSSKFLNDVWQLGFCSIGEVNYQTALYVSGYIMKKVTGKGKNEHYRNVSPTDKNTGEVITITPEYSQASRRPAIGKRFLEKYRADLYPSDEVIIMAEGKTKKVGKPPRYYDKIFEEEIDPKEFERVRSKRQREMERLADEYTPERLAEKKKCVIERQRKYRRRYEKGETK
jgi:hypothetical protein